MINTKKCDKKVIIEVVLHNFFHILFRAMAFAINNVLIIGKKILSQTTLNYNVMTLSFCAVLLTGGSVLMVILGGIVGARLAPSPGLATLPMSLIVVATALTTVPATMIMSRFGRRAGFSLAAFIGAVGAAVGAYAISVSSFVLFCGAGVLIGVKLGFSQQFRFAAAESVHSERAGRAISMVLLGSIGGAFLGPALATQSWLELATPNQGSLVILSVLYVLAGLVLLSLKPQSVSTTTQVDSVPERSLKAVVTQPLFLVAVLAGVVGQGVMTFIMTATPISMHVMNDFSLVETSRVIRGHVVAMYAPALVTGYLIDRFRIFPIMGIGIAVMTLTVIVGLMGHAYLHYWWALVLLGVGWNFLFVGGTALLVKSVKPTEKFKAQAVNEFSVFGISALASLLAGTVLFLFGWNSIIWFCVPGLLAMTAALIWASSLRHP